MSQLSEEITMPLLITVTVCVPVAWSLGIVLHVEIKSNIFEKNK